MDRIIKVFCSGAEQERFVASQRVVERYDGFVLVQAGEAEMARIATHYPLEDITDAYTLRLGERTIDTSQPRIGAKGKLLAHPAYEGEKKLSKGPHHHVVQFIGPIKEEWLAAVKKAGGALREPLESFSYVVRADDEALAKVAQLPFVRWAGHLPHSERIAPSALANAGRQAGDVKGELPRTRVLPGTYTVEFFAPADLTAALEEIKDLGFEVLEKEKGASVIVIRDSKSGKGSGPAAAKRIRALSAIHGVRIIRERSVKRTANDVATRIMGSASASHQPGLGLSGEGEVIAICDTGIDSADPQNIHPDFAGRIAAIMSYPITRDYNSYITNPGGDDGAADLDSGHGTHVAGSVLGDGSASAGLPGVSAPIRGLAHKAKLVFQAVEQEMKWKNSADYQNYGRYLLTGIPLDLGTLFADAYAKNARIHSNSWGGGDPGAYDVQCQQLDRFVWEHPDFCIVVAAGNDGSDSDGDGRINPMSVSSPGTAKNCITVGASENDRPAFNSNTYGRWWPSDYPVAPFRNDPMADDPAQVVAFSSRGPTQDGRIKPEVVAPGTFILSTRSRMLAPNNMAWAAFSPSKLYFYMGGTSMATPLTSGAVALVRQYLRQARQIATPSAALLKAALICGATRLPGTAGDGVVCDNDQGFGRVNLDAILAPAAPAQAQFIDVAPGLRTGELYTQQIDIQSAGTPLRVVLAYSDYPGAALVNNLNLILTAPDGRRFVGNQGAGALTMDARNNVEAIHVVSPQPGAWRLEVVGSNIPQGPQPFALVYTAQTGQAAISEVIRAETSPALAIPDNKPKGVSSTLTIDQSALIGSIKVAVEIQHSYIGDLKVELAAPSGAVVLLHNRSGASTDNLIKSYDGLNTAALAALGGTEARGTWRLTVSDNARRDSGTLRRWSVEILPAASAAVVKESAPFISIPDNDPAGVEDAIEVGESGRVKEIKVWLDITHTYIGDLRVQLLAPSGKGVMLHDRSGAGQDNIIRSFDTASLAALQGMQGEGVTGGWRLKVTDHAGRDVGKLNKWGIEITV